MSEPGPDPEWGQREAGGGREGEMCDDALARWQRNLGYSVRRAVRRRSSLPGGKIHNFILDILHLEHREENLVQDVNQAAWHQSLGTWAA